jgi:hypothetical protein
MADLRRVIALSLRQWGEQGSRCASADATFAVAVIPFTPQNYHTTMEAAAGCLRFFSGGLRAHGRDGALRRPRTPQRDVPTL